MGWWETGREDDLTGDGPADSVTEALDAIVKARARRGQPPPTMEELLDAVAQVLRTQKDLTAEDPESLTFRRLVATLQPGPTRMTGGEYGRSDPGIATPLQAAFVEIADEYQESELERKPRVTEMLAAVAFVLGVDPEEYLLLPEGLVVVDIVPQ